MSSDNQLIKTWKVLRTIEGAKGGVRLGDLCKRTSLPERTALRYIRILTESGFPLKVSGRGPERVLSMPGGNELVPPIPLTVSNLVSIYLSSNLLSFLDGTPYQKGLDDVLSKIQATLPEKTVSRLEEIRKSFFAINNPSRQYSRHAGVIATLNEALLSRKQVKMKYRGPRWKAEKLYNLSPYTIFLYKQALYVVGHVEQYDEIRFFAIKRIVSVSILRQSFQVPPEFDLGDYLADAFGLVREKPQTVKVLFDSAVASIVEETVWHPSQKIEHMDNGDLILTLHVGGMDEVMWWVLSYGENAKVLQPPKLVRQMKDTLLAMAARYLSE